MNDYCLDVLRLNCPKVFIDLFKIIRYNINTKTKGSDNMIVNDNRKEKTTQFGYIKCGETFYDSYEDVHAMKIPSCTDEDGDCNAVALSNGALLYYECEDQVVVTKARIEIYE